MYELNSDDVADQLTGLPADALTALAEVRLLLEIAPWSGQPVSIANPDGAVRFVPFASAGGSGFVYYLILEEQRRVDLLQLIWLS